MLIFQGQCRPSESLHGDVLPELDQSWVISGGVSRIHFMGSKDNLVNVLAKRELPCRVTINRSTAIIHFSNAHKHQTNSPHRRSFQARVFHCSSALERAQQTLKSKWNPCTKSLLQECSPPTPCPQVSRSGILPCLLSVLVQCKQTLPQSSLRHLLDGVQRCLS